MAGKNRGKSFPPFCLVNEGKEKAAITSIPTDSMIVNPKLAKKTVFLTVYYSNLDINDLRESRPAFPVGCPCACYALLNWQQPVTYNE